LGENGAFTTTKPSAPDHLVFVGVVVRATNNGLIYVATQNGYELGEIHDVKTNGKADKDVLMWNSASAVWINDQINLGTDTVGNYMSGVSASTGIYISHTPGEGSTATVLLDANLDEIKDVSYTGSLAVNDFLKWDGSIWTNDHVHLGLNTTGDYLFNVVGGTGVTVNHTPGEGSSASVSIGQDVSTSSSVTFLAVTSTFHGDVIGEVSDISNHSINALGDVNLGVAASGNFLKYNGTEWIAAPIPEINEIDDIGDVTVSSPTTGQILAYNGSVWVNQDNSAGVTNLDGGTTLIEIYEAEITNKVEAVYDGGTV
jgi:hypothetical protein